MSAENSSTQSFMGSPSTVIVLDFGSQYTQLIARRIRELKVYATIQPGDISLRQLQALEPKLIILSGGPSSCTEENAPFLSAEFYEYCTTSHIPLLGICYGLQIITVFYGGKTDKAKDGGEYGRTKIRFDNQTSLLFSSEENELQTVWMSHFDEIHAMPEGFKAVAHSEKGVIVAIENKEKMMFGLQYHPEVTHTERGVEFFRRLLFDICKLSANWSVQCVLDEQLASIKKQVDSNDHMICALSGGVDSTVAALLVHKAVGNRLHCVFIDHGLLRYKERDRVQEMFEKELHLPVSIIDHSHQMLEKLKGVIEPEEKRKIIGAEFIEVFEEFKESLQKSIGIKPKYLVQGTLYPDVIESCPPPGTKLKHSHKIKSHHNVGGLPENLNFKLIEPLKELFKDEVRKLGKLLRVPDAFIRRQPFPGPGLAIRILGDITLSRLDILQQADEIFIQTIKEYNLYDEIWQAFAVYIPINTVGVQGDARSYGNIIGLRAVRSSDGMTADWYPFEAAFLQDVSSRITNSIQSINRVIYDITNKPPGTIEWE